MKKYCVRFMMDSTYEVYNSETNEAIFQGGIAECEAWIRLNEDGRFM